jgi:hypothetical protein
VLNVEDNYPYVAVPPTPKLYRCQVVRPYQFPHEHNNLDTRLTILRKETHRDGFMPIQLRVKDARAVTK